jgi:hypothetical protein
MSTAESLRYSLLNEIATHGEDAAMEALKLIPQIFFDLIARVVPGAVAILLLDLGIPGFWAALIGGLSANKLDSTNAAVFVFMTLLGLSYVIGQIVAPLGKLLEKVGPHIDSLAYLFAEGVNPKRPVISILRDELGNPDAYVRSCEKVIWYWYDWLRVHQPDAGALTAKIRAEYGMYYGLSAVLTLGTIGEFLIRRSVGSLPWPGVVLTLIVLAVFMFMRGRDTDWTFRKSVCNLYYVSKHKDLPCA